MTGVSNCEGRQSPRGHSRIGNGDVRADFNRTDGIFGRCGTDPPPGGGRSPVGAAGVGIGVDDSGQCLGVAGPARRGCGAHV